ncbi:MAG: RNA polymerase sigma-54 factor, partial [Alphaproteobacteria bacterium]
MAVSQRMDLRQSQTLVMTPQLQQAIKLLELSNLELAAYVEGELEQNPLLERADAEGEPRDAPPGSEPAGDEAREATGDEPVVGLDEYARAEHIGDGGHTSFDTDYDNIYDGGETPFVPGGAGDASAWGAGARGGGRVGEESGIDQTVAGEISLRDHLLAQLGLDVSDPTERLIGLQLIDLLDEAGYITADLAAVAETL